jgi:hypothetical protein
MLPLVPLAIREDFHGRVAALVRESVLVNALLRGGVAPAHRRVPKGLRRMVQQLGITERRYLQLVAEVVARAAE